MTPSTGKTSSEIAAMPKPNADDSGCEPFDQRANGLDADIDRHDEHRDDDPRLGSAFEVFRCDRIGSFLPKSPHEHD